MVAQPLTQGSVRVEAYDIAKIAMNVLVIVRPRALPGAAPGSYAIDVFDDALHSLFGLGLLRLGSQGLNLLQQRDKVMGVAEQDLVEFSQRSSGCVEQRLTSFDRTEPIRLQKFGDLCLHLFLLRIEPTLPALNAANKIANSYPQWSRHSIPPGILGVSALGCCKDLGELGPKRAREQGQALACECFIGEEVLDDCGRQSRQRVLTGSNDACPVHSRQHALVAEPLDGVRSALAWALRAGIDHVAYLLEHVDEHVLFERRKRRPIGPQVKACEKTQVERFQIQNDPVTREGGNEAARIRRHQRLLPMFAAAMA
jgi:hypothetical protein